MPLRRFVATVELAAPSTPPPIASLPPEVRSALERSDDEVLVAALSPYLTANFVAENVDGIDELLAVDDEAQASHVVIDRVVRAPRGFVKVSARAWYDLEVRVALDDEMLSTWQDDHGEYLTDAVNFAWSFPDLLLDAFDGWLTNHEGAGFGLDDDAR